MQLLSTLQITGNDAAQFLQNLFTNDVLAMPENGSQLNSYCNIQGRVVALFTLARHENGFLIQLPTERSQALLQKLRLYILRSDVQLADISDQHHNEQRVLADIQRGIPHIVDATAEKFLPQMLNLDVLNGMSFTKGCYPGQEIVIRTQHKGAIKRRTRRFATNIAPPVAYTAVLLAGKTVGHTLQAAATEHGCELLAVINQDAPRDQLCIDDQDLRELPLPYEV